MYCTVDHMIYWQLLKRTSIKKSGTRRVKENLQNFKTSKFKIKMTIVKIIDYQNFWSLTPYSIGYTCKYSMIGIMFSFKLWYHRKNSSDLRNRDIKIINMGRNESIFGRYPTCKIFSVQNKMVDLNNSI